MHVIMMLCFFVKEQQTNKLHKVCTMADDQAYNSRHIYQLPYKRGDPWTHLYKLCKNKPASLEATQFENTTHQVTGVMCRATSVAKNLKGYILHFAHTCIQHMFLHMFLHNLVKGGVENKWEKWC